ncbi:hypothetical protein SAMN05216417_10187 [Nitrosospira multiformis]|uniref:Uncharacterized protein n=1 Tax=Nitrosospira multiformis TaxID=1231 RepID=A0A1I7F349_9PROT|nr:hypothetical protein SAMN05216417_10187 [Nitrosospira multiformis]
MRIILVVYSVLTFVGMTSPAHAEPTIVRAAEPLRLTETQMDVVSAGTTVVTTGASATAEGSNTHTYTSTSTTVIGTPLNIVSAGLGSAKAYACCGSGTDTNVQTGYYSDADIVIANSLVNDASNPVSSSSNGVITVIAVDVPLLQ